MIYEFLGTFLGISIYRSQGALVLMKRNASNPSVVLKSNTKIANLNKTVHRLGSIRVYRI